MYGDKIIPVITKIVSEGRRHHLKKIHAASTLDSRDIRTFFIDNE